MLALKQCQKQIFEILEKQNNKGIVDLKRTSREEREREIVRERKREECHMSRESWILNERPRPTLTTNTDADANIGADAGCEHRRQSRQTW